MEILRRRYKIRPVSHKYKQVTVPPECTGLPLGQEVNVVHTDSWMMVVPAGTPVDEEKLKDAIKLPKEK